MLPLIFPVLPLECASLLSPLMSFPIVWESFFQVADSLLPSPACLSVIRPDFSLLSLMSFCNISRDNSLRDISVERGERETLLMF